ncbi:SOS response-associated peptidase [Pedobacter rhodius]|uniref:Abasic site processing protein n=2 Tax=Pedobacter TaxID=84567 RepID=A0ABT4L0K3_9SPHI|nr:SOS response-associated peptidase family protein [Pedobacter sp. SJ11]MCZ4224711.1 SOS response-associated peptidase family protein [Pedobacter sp. SJ11]
MCYYNGQRVSRAEFISLLQLEKAVKNYQFLDRAVHNGFAYSPVAVLKRDAEQTNFDIVQMEWGFLPPYLKNREAAKNFRNGYKDAAGKWHIGYTTLNAKAENLFSNEKGGPSIYAKAARERRCLVLSTGFYEWRHVFPKNKKTGEPLKTAVKYPYYISVKDEEYFYMAAIYQEWTDQETGEIVETVAVTTAPANPLMEQVHNSKKRMPTILNDELAYEWMFGDLSDGRITEIASSQFPAKQMDACTIAKEFLSTLEPSTPFIYEDLPAIEYSI